MAHTFLLEIGLEDMPAGVITQAENQLVQRTKEYLDEANLSFKEVLGYSTPRRFAVIVKDLAEKQQDETLIVRGPAQKIAVDSNGEWTKAAIGFSKGQGGNVEDLVIKEEKGIPYVFIEKFVEGKSAKEILQGISEVIKKIEFPKQMKWGNNSYQYVRPIHWLVALLDDEVVPFEVFDVETGQVSQGHRFLGKEVTIYHPNEYVDKLNEQFVMVDRLKRKEEIVQQIKALCEKMNWHVPNKQNELLEEVTDLVEYPTAFYGKFDESYLELPDVVLETSMRDHQRYFPVRSNDSEEKLLAFFISVRNGDKNHLENVARGNEKVLSARLADAQFFYAEDQKTDISDFVEKLKNVDYHEQLGTIYDKQLRAQKIVEVMSNYLSLSEEEITDLNRIASIYKFDLVSQIVDEFPTLQGTIGGIYAKEQNESEVVSKAISEQYLPLTQIDQLPETKLGKIIALIDKLDTLVQFFSIGLIPTGSNDPHALRRQAIGVVRLLLSLDQGKIELKSLLQDVVKASQLPDERQENLEENIQALNAFILDRLEQMMRSEYNISHDVRKATFGAIHTNLSRMISVANVLEAKKEKENYKEVVESVTRVLNMVKTNGQTGTVQTELLETESEKALANAIEELTDVFVTSDQSDVRYAAIEAIRPFITEFFDHNMVMVSDENVKENRLTLLNNLAEVTREFADFSALVI